MSATGTSRDAPHKHTHACIHGKLGNPAGAARLAPLQHHAAALPPEKAASIDGGAGSSSHTAPPPSHLSLIHISEPTRPY